MVKCYHYNYVFYCQLFDSFVGAILNYSSEMCGFSKSKELERLHLKFCKRILKVPLSSSNAAIYGELERYTLYISRYCKIIKYWCKIVQSENIILNRLYTLAVKDCLSGYTNWVSRVNKLLDDYGFSEVFLNVSTCNYFVKNFLLYLNLELLIVLDNYGLVRFIETEP